MTPIGFSRHTRRSPVTDPWEPLFSREADNAVHLAVEIRTAHCNSRGFAHGGILTALADNAMGLSAVRLAQQRSAADKVNAVTVTLSLDFIDTAEIGDWVEFIPEVLKAGRTLAFVDSRIMSGERLIGRGNGTFRIV